MRFGDAIWVGSSGTRHSRSPRAQVPRVAAKSEAIMKDAVEDCPRSRGYILGMECYVFGFPIVIMDVTRQ